MAIFNPTGTSKLLIESVKPHIVKGKLLDLGCGCGVVGASFRDKCQVSASDLSQEACDYVDKKYSDIRVRCGSLFSCWDEQFDYIVDDVSGVVPRLGKLWFDGVPNDSGDDGADLVCQVLIEAPKYLYEKGILFFPIVSLSNSDRILKLANHLYNIERIGHQDFPLPKELLNTEIPKEYITERFGIKLFSTDIYKATIDK